MSMAKKSITINEHILVCRDYRGRPETPVREMKNIVHVTLFY
jgi:hypothetical protein